jgi:glyoxylase I family protein
MRPSGIHHVSINVNDVDAGRAFYVDVLGLTERTDRPVLDVDGAWLDAAGQQVHLVVGEPAPFVGQHFAVLVDDVTATCAELRATGLRVSTPVAVGSGLQCFLRDPFGNVVELHQVGGAATA